MVWVHVREHLLCVSSLRRVKAVHAAYGLSTLENLNHPVAGDEPLAEHFLLAALQF